MEQHLVAYQHGAEKHQLYLNHYERHFQQLVQHHVDLLELGIYRGGSLLQWRDFFRNGQIVGLDLDPVSIDDPTGRIVTYQGDQADLALLDRIAHERAPGGFDIIIDDASHIAALTKISFWHLFDNHLKPGGYYVIEDWRVSYSDAAERMVQGTNGPLQCRSDRHRRSCRITPGRAWGRSIKSPAG